MKHLHDQYSGLSSPVPPGAQRARPTRTWVMSSRQTLWKLSWLRLGGPVLARGPRMTMRLEISGGLR